MSSRGSTCCQSIRPLVPASGASVRRDPTKSNARATRLISATAGVCPTPQSVNAGWNAAMPLSTTAQPIMLQSTLNTCPAASGASG